MSNAASNWLEDATLDFWLNANSGGYSSPSTLYLGLFYGTASSVLANLESGTLSDEITLGNYSRQTVSFGSPSGGTISNDAAVTFPTATANYDGAVTCVAIIANVGGTDRVLWAGELSVSKTVTTGDQFQVAVGNLQVSLT